MNNKKKLAIYVGLFISCAVSLAYSNSSSAKGSVVGGPTREQFTKTVVSAGWIGNAKLGVSGEDVILGALTSTEHKSQGTDNEISFPPMDILYNRTGEIFGGGTLTMNPDGTVNLWSDTPYSDTTVTTGIGLGSAGLGGVWKHIPTGTVKNAGRFAAEQGSSTYGHIANAAGIYNTTVSSTSSGYSSHPFAEFVYNTTGFGAGIAGEVDSGLAGTVIGAGYSYAHDYMGNNVETVTDYMYGDGQLTVDDMFNMNNDIYDAADEVMDMVNKVTQSGMVLTGADMRLAGPSERVESVKNIWKYDRRKRLENEKKEKMRNAAERVRKYYENEYWENLLLYAEIVSEGGDDIELRDWLIQQQQERGDMKGPGTHSVDKPNIYLYPEEEMEITVLFANEGTLVVTEPVYNNGWTVMASPDGTLNDGEKEWDYLFYECELSPYVYQTEEGFILNADNRENALRDVLNLYGFNAGEQADFMEYWMKRLDADKDYVMYPITKDKIDIVMPVTYSVLPDCEYRIWFAFVDASLVNSREVKQPTIMPIIRDGYTVVEWGGSLFE